MHQVSRLGKRGRRQTGRGARCASSCEKRVLLLCEPLEDRLAPAVFMNYDQIGDVDIQGKGHIELKEYQFGQQTFLKIDVGRQGFDSNSSQPVPGRLIYFPTGSPVGSNFALILDNRQHSIPTLRITGKSDVSFTIPNLNSGIDSVLVEANKATFLQYDNLRGFVTVNEADINGPTTIADLTAAKTIVNNVVANFLGRTNFGELDVTPGGGVRLNGDATAGDLTNLGSFFVYGGLTAAGLTNEGNFLVAAGGSLQVTNFINTSGATFKAQDSKVEGRKLDNSGEMLWLAAAFGFTDLKNSNAARLSADASTMHFVSLTNDNIMNFQACQVTVSDFVNTSGATFKAQDSKVEGRKLDNKGEMLWLAAAFGFTDLKNTSGGSSFWGASNIKVSEDLTQTDGTLIFNRVQLTVGRELALNNVALNVNESNIRVGVSTTVTGGTTNIVAGFISSFEYRQRFGEIRIDPTSRFAVTDGVSIRGGKLLDNGQVSGRDATVSGGGQLQVGANASGQFRKISFTDSLLLINPLGKVTCVDANFDHSTAVNGGTFRPVASALWSHHSEDTIQLQAELDSLRYEQSGDSTTTVAPGGKLVSPTVIIQDGSFTDNGMVIGNVFNNGMLAGFGIVNGNVLNNAQVTPGTNGNPGILTIHGNYTQTNNGTLCIQIGTTGSGELVVTGMARVDGTLALKAINNFAPMVNAEYLFLNAGTIDGVFTDVDLNLPNPWQPELFMSPNAFFVKLTQPL